MEKARHERMREMCFLSGGQRHAGFVQSTEDWRILEDSRLDAQAHGLIRNKYRLDKPDNYIDLDAMIAAHGDADYTRGLVHVLADETIAVRRFLHNGLFSEAFARKGASAGLVDDLTEPQVAEKLTPSMKRLAKAIEKARANLPKAVAGKRAQGRETPDAVPLECRRLDQAQGFVDGFSDGELKLDVL